MDIKNTTDYPSILGRVFSKVFDNPYGKEIRFNGYHTTSLAEVRIGYDGKEPLTDVAAAISKIVKPYGFKAIAVEPYLWGINPLNVNTYNIKVVADNKEKTRTMKVKNTMKVAGKVTEVTFPTNYKTAEECKARIERELAKTYGKEWKELHGDDLTTDENGNPFYEFDMGEGDFERFEVVLPTTKSIKCRLVLNTAMGSINDFGEYPSIAAAVRAAKDSGYFRYRIFVGNKVVREGFCNN